MVSESFLKRHNCKSVPQSKNKQIYNEKLEKVTPYASDGKTVVKPGYYLVTLDLCTITVEILMQKKNSKELSFEPISKDSDVYKYLSEYSK